MFILNIFVMKKLYFLLALIPAIFVSCHSDEYLYKYNESTARYLQPTMSGFITPTTADLNVSPTRITHSETFANELTEDDFEISGTRLRKVNDNEESNLLNYESPLIQYMKNYTIGQAVKKYQADIIVGPIFEIKTSEDYEKITVTISGYPASYTNFRKTTDADINLMDKVYKIGKVGTDTVKSNPKIIYVN